MSSTQTHLNLGGMAEASRHPNYPRVMNEYEVRKNRRINRENELSKLMNNKRIVRGEKGLKSDDYADLPGGNKKDGINYEYVRTPNEERIYNNYRAYFKSG